MTIISIVFLKSDCPERHTPHPCVRCGTSRILPLLRKVPFLFLSLLMFALILPGTARSADKAGNNFESATKLIQQGLYLEALGIYGEISESDSSRSERARAFLFTGSVYKDYLNLPKIALKYLRMVNDFYPETRAGADALFNRGMILYDEGRFRDAHDCFTFFIKKYPENMRVRSARIWAKSTEKKTPAPPANRMHNGVMGMDTQLRVLIRKNIQSVTFTSTAPITISEASSEKRLYRGPGPADFLYSDKGILINKVLTGANQFTIESDNRKLSIDQRPYRGLFALRKTDTQRFTVINHLPVEEYLLGVVPSEMDESSPTEALKAQAVASRTYALYIKNRQTPGAFHDIKATTSAQVYGGFDAERKRTSAAVFDTRGKVMTYDGELIISYFHADSGGQTENPVHVWGAEVPYLKGVSDEFSTSKGSKPWSQYLSMKDIENRFKKSGIYTGEIIDILPENTSPSGRVLKLTIAGNKKTTRVTGNDFRIIMGAANFKSTLVSLRREKKGIRFTGYGYGHGVGMSQAGAKNMANEGHSYMGILEQYYRDITLAAVHTPRAGNRQDNPTQQ